MLSLFDSCPFHIYAKQKQWLIVLFSEIQLNHYNSTLDNLKLR